MVFFVPDGSGARGLNEFQYELSSYRFITNTAELTAADQICMKHMADNAAVVHLDNMGDLLEINKQLLGYRPTASIWTSNEQYQFSWTNSNIYNMGAHRICAKFISDIRSYILGSIMTKQNFVNK